MLDHVFSFKGEPEKVKNKIVEKNFYLIAHNRSGFDPSFVWNKLPQWRSDVNLIKNGAGIVSLKLFNGYVGEKIKKPQFVHFSCRRSHIDKTLKKKSRKLYTTTMFT